MAIPAVTTAALLSAPLVVLLFVFGHMVTSAPTELCLESCTCYNDIQNHKLMTVNCSSFRPVLTAASSLLSDFSFVDVLNVQNVADGSSDHIIDGLFGVFSNVKSMSLTNASITKIDPNAFKGLKHLEELDLSNNGLYKFRPETFSETPKLKVLDLSNNPLRLAPTTFLISKSLEELSLSSCNLTSVPAGSFKGLPNLKVLDLYDNHIQSFTIRSFPRNLKHLWLTKNNLTNISTKVLSSLNKLTRLDLSENPINCTCSLIGLQDWFSSKGIIFENEVICRYPMEYQGESLTHVFENEVCLENVGTLLTSKKQDASENSCENEICDESAVEDRYIYNAVQADQPVTESPTPTEYSTIEINKMGDESATLASSKVTDTMIPDINHIEITTENVLDASDDSKMNESKNLVEDVTHLNDIQELVTSEPDNLDTTSNDNIDGSQSDSTNIFAGVTESSEISRDELGSTDNSVVTEVPINVKAPDVTEQNLIDGTQPSKLPLDVSETTTADELKTTPMPQNFETTTFKSDLNPSEVPHENVVEDDSQSVLKTTTEDVMSAKNVIEEINTTPGQEPTTTPGQEPTTTPVQNPTNVSPEEDLMSSLREDSTIDPTTLVQSSTPVTIPTTDPIDVPVSTARSDDEVITTVKEIPETTTSAPIITTTMIVPITSTSGNENDDISKSNMDILTSTPSSPTTTTESTIVTEIYRALNENKEHIHETTSTGSVETTTLIVPSISIAEKTNHVPDSKEETTSTTEKVTVVGQELNLNPTNTTESLVVLPSTENRKGKMLSSTEDGEQRPPESMGSYIVLAGIIIVLLLLILYATTKKSQNSSNKKIPLQDAENNMTELQDMTTLLPSSPAANGNKNNKYPNEEPSVTAKLLETDDQPDTNGNGYRYPQDKVPNRTAVPEKPEDSNGKSTLPKTNGSSNGAPPLELTKAKVIVMHDSLPRTPIYIQKNVNS